MTSPPEKPDETSDQVNQVFFAAVLAINIFMFVAIAALEYRAFALAKWRGGEAGLAIEIDPPDGGVNTEEHRLALFIARRMYSDGREGFHKCALCHSIIDDTPNFGPNLTCLFGQPGVEQRRIADASDGTNLDYRYSKALIAQSERHDKWSLPLFDLFVHEPLKFNIEEVEEDSSTGGVTLHATRMPFPGLTDRVERRDVAQFILWSCQSRTGYENLKIVDFAGAGDLTEASCVAHPFAKHASKLLQLPLEDAADRFAKDWPHALLAPSTPPGCSEEAP